MQMRYAVLAVLILTLAGCVLQSKEPVFSDEQASLVFGAVPVTMRSYSWKDGGWVEEKENLALTVEGRHYVAKEDGDTAGLAFIPLSGGWFAVQATEEGKAVNYTLATVKDGAAVFHLLECDALKKRAGLEATRRLLHQGRRCRDGTIRRTHQAAGRAVGKDRASDVRGFG
jgi:hypothetical protein